MTGLYRPGTSLVHRATPGAKLGLLALLTTALVMARSPLAVAVAAVACLLGYAAAGWAPVVALQQVWPLRWLLLVLVPFQLWTAGWRGAVVVTGTLVVAVAAACLLTLTTRVGDLLDTLVRLLAPVRLVGVDPERAGLTLALAVRSVPVVGAAAREVADARRARGLERSVRALAVPLVVRTIRHAERTGDALAARGFDD